VSGSLRLLSVKVDAFGGLKDRLVKIGDDPFVVIAGDNETGKSSLSTLLGWLLVGTSGDAAFAQRFGPAGTTIGGSLEAQLGDEPVTASGMFTVPLKGKTNEKPLSVVWRGGNLSAAQWRKAALHDLDAVVLDAVYRMAGATLHAEDAVLAEIAELAMTGMAGPVSAAGVLSRLESQVARALTSEAGGNRPFKVLSKEANAARREVEGRKVHTSDYLAGQSKLNQLGSERARLETDLLDARTRLRAHEDVLAMIGLRQKIDSIDTALAELDEVPEGWDAVAVLLPEIERAVPAVLAAAADRESAAVRFDQLRAELGLTRDEAQAVQVTEVEMSTIIELREERAKVQGAIDGVVRGEADAASALDAASTQLADALLACPDLDEAALRGVVLDASTREEMRRAVNALERAEDDAAAARRSHDEAVTAAARATADVSAKRAQWDRLGVGADPDAWVGATSHGQRGPVRPGVVPVLVAGLVAAGAVLAAPRLVAAGVTVVAVVVAVVVAIRNRPQPASPGDPAAIRDVASAVRDAAAVLQNRNVEVAARQAAVTSAEVRVEQAQQAVDGVLGAAGFSSTGSAVVHRARLVAVEEALKALKAVDAAGVRLSAAVRARQDAADRLADADEALRVAVRAAGLPDRLPLAMVANKVMRFNTLTTCHHELVRHADAVTSAGQALAAVVAPVAGTVAGSAPEDLLQRCRDVATVVDERTRLGADRRGLEAQIDARVRDVPGARELADRQLSEDVLRLAQSDCGETVDRLVAELEEVKAESVRLEQSLRQAEEEDRLADLQLRVGVLEERMDEQVLEAASARLASVLLGEVAEEQRRLRQPALIRRANDMLGSVVPAWDEVRIDPVGSSFEVSVRRHDGAVLSMRQLSTGARALVYLALRLAAAEQDAERRGGLRMPFICDDPLVHLDGPRSRAAVGLLAKTAERGHQVLLFTCHERTEHDAAAVGAAVRHF
jgi:uncharacterized protein YhaN